MFLPSIFFYLCAFLLSYVEAAKIRYSFFSYLPINFVNFMTADRVDSESTSILAACHLLHVDQPLDRTPGGSRPIFTYCWTGRQRGRVPYWPAVGQDANVPYSVFICCQKNFAINYYCNWIKTVNEMNFMIDH